MIFEFEHHVCLKYGSVKNMTHYGEGFYGYIWEREIKLESVDFVLNVSAILATYSAFL